MIKKWNEFIREFVESTGLIDAKMQELKDLIDGMSDGQNLIYEWENKDDHQLLVNFTTGNLSLRYEFDIDDLHVTKIAGDTVDYKTNVESMEEGLDLIEKDIQSILGIDEKKLLLFEDFNEVILEKNIPTNSSLWSECKSWAKSKYDVWPSAYAVGAAAKRYKSKGGKWEKEKKSKK